jgi:hypothetical protein
MIFLYILSATSVCCEYIDWNDLTGSRKSVKDNHLRDCGNVMAEYKDKIVIIEGATIKSHEYIIPKLKVDHIDENSLYLNISRHDMILNFDF